MAKLLVVVNFGNSEQTSEPVCQKLCETLCKLSENIYFIEGFMKRVTVKQRPREVVIWGTLIP